MRRLTHRVPGPATSSDIETWVTPEAWSRAVTAIADAMVRLHDEARPARTPGTIHVSASTQGFVMADEA